MNKEINRLREQLRLTIIDAAMSEAEANDNRRKSGDDSGEKEDNDG
jgi:hypothetical protein